MRAYRKKILRGRIAERVRDLIRQTCAARGVSIIRGSVSPDHIHLLLSAPPILAPAKLAQGIKGRSSRLMQAEFPELRKQYGCCASTARPWSDHLPMLAASRSNPRSRMLVEGYSSGVPNRYKVLGFPDGATAEIRFAIQGSCRSRETG
jgi:hypothetical protein